MSSDDRDTRESRDQTTPSADESVRETDDLASDSTEKRTGSADETPTDAPQADVPEAAGDGEPVPESAGPDNSASESTDEPQVNPELSEDAQSEAGQPEDAPSADEPPEGEPPEAKPKTAEAEGESPSTFYDDPYDEYEYEYEEPQAEKSADVSSAQPEPAKTPPSPPPPVDTEDDEDDDEEGMSRMSFLDHLEELRTRIIRALSGLVIAYAISLTAKDYLFQIMRRPFDQAVEMIKLTHPENTDMVIQLVALTPIEQFHLIWFKLPIVASLFIAAPWWMLQVWSFVAPGLYKKERRWAMPFIFSGGILFILGGAFGYFVALNFALAFLLDVGSESGVVPLIGISAYSDMFIGILLGLGVVFQMPIVIFILTALRIASPKFLMDNVRYAILVIFVLAAVITPTPDIFNMITFATPMILLFYVGIFVSYIFLLKREGKSLPWGKILLVVLIVLAVIAGLMYYLYSEMGYRFVTEFPWFVGPIG